ncbi:Retrovirus-related Pol polyprotein from transposon 17.6, partial [Mucuna pruriens]
VESIPGSQLYTRATERILNQPTLYSTSQIRSRQSSPKLTKDVSNTSLQALLRKCRDPKIFSVPCIIGDCTFVDAMLDLGASINMTIQLPNRSVVQPLGILEDVLVQFNELIFPGEFYVLHTKDETSGKGSTLILGRTFLMTARTKIDVHAGMLLMEFGDTLVQFNNFEAMKHHTEDHSLLGIYLINDLVEEYFQLDTNGEDISIFTRDTKVFDCLGSVIDEANCGELREVHNLSNSEDDSTDLADLISQSDPKLTNDTSSSPPPPIKLKPMLSHLKYAYLDTEQQLPIIIANNLHREKEEKLLDVLRQHKNAIGWKLSNLPSINPPICMHRILMEEEAQPIRKQQRRLNSIILDVVKKEVTKLLAIGIIYPILDSQWVSRVQKDHFPLPFIDQILEKLAGKSHYFFLDGFSGYMQIHIAPEDWHKMTFTCPFDTFAYTRMPFGLCNALSTFQRCMISIFSDFLQDYMEVFMDNFIVYIDSFDACLGNLSKVLTRCIDTNLVLNFEKCHFMVIEGIMLGHLVSNRGIKVDRSKIDIITSLPNPTSVREVRSFLRHAGFYRRFIKNFSKIALPLSKLLQKDVEFNFD